MNKTPQKLRLSLAIVFMSMLHQSCVYEKMTHLTEDEMEWVNAINIGDSFLFVSNYGHTDTLYITDKLIENSNSPIHGFNRRLFDTYEAFAKYQFDLRKQLKNKRDYDSGSFTILKVEDARRLGFATDFQRRYSLYNLHIDIYNNLFDELILFKDIDPNIQNYLVVDDNNSKYSRYDDNLENKIIKYIFNQQYGLIYYKYENGEEFTRVFK